MTTDEIERLAEGVKQRLRGRRRLGRVRDYVDANPQPAPRGPRKESPMTTDEIERLAEGVKQATIAALTANGGGEVTFTAETEDSGADDGWVVRAVKSRTITITLTPPAP